MKIFKNLSKTRVISAFTMIEIMIGLVIVAVAIIPVVGVMSSTNKASEHGEAMIQASDYCRNIMDTLLNDVRFKCLLPGGQTYGYVKNSLSGVINGGGELHSWAGWATEVNLAQGANSPTIIQDKANPLSKVNPKSSPNPLICTADGAFAPDDKYVKGLLHSTGWDNSGNRPWTYRDERGMLYYVNVTVRVVPVMFRYLNTTEYSWGSGNISDKAQTTFNWGLSYFPDETQSGSIDYVFGDEPVSTTNHSGVPPLYLAGDMPDARMKKIVVSIFLSFTTCVLPAFFVHPFSQNKVFDGLSIPIIITCIESSSVSSDVSFGSPV